MLAETLDNGLTLLWADQPHLNTSCIGVFIPGGPVYEEHSMFGVCHFLEHLHMSAMVRRTGGAVQPSRPSPDTLNARTCSERIEFLTMAPPDMLGARAVFLANLLEVKDYPQQLIEEERELILAELATPGGAAVDEDRSIFELLDPYHPLSRPIAGTPKTVARLKHDDVRRYNAVHFDPSHAVVVVTGKTLQHERMLLREAMGGLPPGPRTPLQPAAFPRISLPQIAPCGGYVKGQRTVTLGWYISECLTAEQRVGLEFITLGLESGYLREDVQYRESSAYWFGVELGSRCGIHCLFVNGVANRVDRDQYAARVLSEFHRLRNGEGINGWVDSVRQELRFRLLAGQDSPVWLAQRLGVNEVTFGWNPPPSSIDKELELIENMTSKVITEVAREYMTYERFFMFFEPNRLFGDVKQMTRLVEASFKD